MEKAHVDGTVNLGPPLRCPFSTRRFLFVTCSSACGLTYPPCISGIFSASAHTDLHAPDESTDEP